MSGDGELSRGQASNLTAASLRRLAVRVTQGSAARRPAISKLRLSHCGVREVRTTIDNPMSAMTKPTITRGAMWSMPDLRKGRSWPPSRNWRVSAARAEPQRARQKKLAALCEQSHRELRHWTLAVAQLSCVRAAANEIQLPANLRADRLKERIAWQSERIEMTPGGKISRELASRRQSWARRRWWRRLLSPDLPACRAPDSSSRSPVLVGVPVRI